MTLTPDLAECDSDESLLKISNNSHFLQYPFFNWKFFIELTPILTSIHEMLAKWLATVGCVYPQWSMNGWMASVSCVKWQHNFSLDYRMTFENDWQKPFVENILIFINTSLFTYIDWKLDFIFDIIKWILLATKWQVN